MTRSFGLAISGLVLGLAVLFGLNGTSTASIAHAADDQNNGTSRCFLGDDWCEFSIETTAKCDEQYTFKVYPAKVERIDSDTYVESVTFSACAPLATFRTAINDVQSKYQILTQARATPITAVTVQKDWRTAVKRSQLGYYMRMTAIPQVRRMASYPLDTSHASGSTCSGNDDLSCVVIRDERVTCSEPDLQGFTVLYQLREVDHVLGNPKAGNYLLLHACIFPSEQADLGKASLDIKGYLDGVRHRRGNVVQTGNALQAEFVRVATQNWFFLTRETRAQLAHVTYGGAVVLVQELD